MHEDEEEEGGPVHPRGEGRREGGGRAIGGVVNGEDVIDGVTTVARVWAREGFAWWLLLILML